MKQKLLILLLFSLISIPGFSQLGSLNVALLGHLSYQQDLNDIWGYVDSSGTEYALVGVYNGVSIVSLANPANPTELFFLPGVGSTWRDLKTWGNHAYVTNESGDGLRIIDLAGLPNSINYKDTIIGGMSTAHNLWIDEFGYAYLVGNNSNFGFKVLDLNQDPWYPVLTGPGYSTQYIHDVYVRDNKAYAAEIYTGNLTIIDVTDKNNINILGTTTYPNAFTHNTWLDSSGTVCFTTDELGQAYIHAFDVSNPSNIVMLDRIRSSQSGGNATPHNTHYFNGFLVTSYYEDGLQIVDAHRPQNLVEVGFLDTQPLANVGTFGAWGAYPFLPSGIALITDIGEGLFVVGPNYTRAAYLEGTAYVAGTSTVLSNVDITVDNTSLAEITDNSGIYRTGTVSTGSFTVHANKFGYLPTDTTLNLSSGVLTIWNPQMQVAPTVGMNVLVVDASTGAPIPGAEVSALSSGMLFSYVANASGEVIDPALIESNYSIFAGKWGYVTNGVNMLVDSSTGLITIQLSKGYYDDFAFDFGWTTSGNASTGMWERGNPIGTFFFPPYTANPEDDVVGDWGDQCFVTGNGGGDMFFDDVDAGYTMLTSPSMDLTSYNNPWMIFDSWFLTTSANGQPGFRDSLSIYIDNGIENKRVWFVKDILRPAWVRDTIKISSHLQLTNNMQIKIRCSDNSFDQVVEGAIDYFRIEDQTVVGTETAEMPSKFFNMAPNPSNGPIRLQFFNLPESQLQIRILDIQGKQMLKQTISSGESQLTLNPDLNAGLYFMILESNGERIQTQKLSRF